MNERRAGSTPLLGMPLNEDGAIAGIGPGVVFTPPHLVADSIKDQVTALLGTIPADKHLVFVGVLTEAGTNIAVAYRVDDRLQVGGWIGKSGWDRPVAGGVFLKSAF